MWPYHRTVFQANSRASTCVCVYRLQFNVELWYADRHRPPNHEHFSLISRRVLELDLHTDAAQNAYRFGSSQLFFILFLILIPCVVLTMRRICDRSVRSWIRFLFGICPYFLTSSLFSGRCFSNSSPFPQWPWESTRLWCRCWWEEKRARRTRLVDLIFILSFHQRGGTSDIFVENRAVNLSSRWMRVDLIICLIWLQPMSCKVRDFHRSMCRALLRSIRSLEVFITTNAKLVHTSVSLSQSSFISILYGLCTVGNADFKWNHFSTCSIPIQSWPMWVRRRRCSPLSSSLPPIPTRRSRTMPSDWALDWTPSTRSSYNYSQGLRVSRSLSVSLIWLISVIFVFVITFTTRSRVG